VMVNGEKVKLKQANVSTMLTERSFNYLRDNENNTKGGSKRKLGPPESFPNSEKKKRERVKCIQTLMDAERAKMEKFLENKRSKLLNRRVLARGGGVSREISLKQIGRRGHNHRN